MAIKADLARLLEFVADEQEKTVSLSRETVFIALVALEHSNVGYRGHWLVDGVALSDGQWDQASALVNLAWQELLQASQAMTQSTLLSDIETLIIRVEFPLE